MSSGEDLDFTVFREDSCTVTEFCQPVMRKQIIRFILMGTFQVSNETCREEYGSALCLHISSFIFLRRKGDCHERDEAKRNRAGWRVAYRKEDFMASCKVYVNVMAEFTKDGRLLPRLSLIHI